MAASHSKGRRICNPTKCLEGELEVSGEQQKASMLPTGVVSGLEEFIYLIHLERAWPPERSAWILARSAMARSVTCFKRE